MKKKLTLALAASMFVLTLSVTPPHASASADMYLTLGDDGSNSTPPKPTFWDDVKHFLLSF
jgi:hypothetical protein